MTNYFTKEHQQYINALQNNTSIKSDSLSLSDTVISRIDLSNLNNEKIFDSNWQEQAKSEVNQITNNIISNIQKMSKFITNNLVTACSLSIDLLDKCLLIKRKDEDLKAKIIELNSLKEPDEKEDRTNYDNRKSELNSAISTLETELEGLCNDVEKIKKTIKELNNNNLSDMEYAKLLSDLNSDGIVEIYPDLATLLGLEGEYEIEGEIPIRFNIDTLNMLLEGNPYKDVIMEYLENFQNEDFSVQELYEKYSDLFPKWNSTKNSPKVLFDYIACNKDVFTSDAKEAMTIVLNHTIYESLLPYYEKGELTLYQDIRVRSTVYCSDFLVQFNYSIYDGTPNKYAYALDASGFVNMGGGRCHYFANGVLIQAMNDFVSDYSISEEINKKGQTVVTNPLLIATYNKDGSIVKTERNGAFYDLFPTKEYPGSSQYQTYGENTSKQEIILGAPTARHDTKNKQYHVVVPQYKVIIQNDDGTSTVKYITAESRSKNNVRGINFNLRTEKEMNNFKYTITPSVLEKTGLSTTPDSFEQNYNQINQ